VFGHWQVYPAPCKATAKKILSLSTSKIYKKWRNLLQEWKNPLRLRKIPPWNRKTCFKNKITPPLGDKEFIMV
jgi:hypothetical protein